MFQFSAMGLFGLTAIAACWAFAVILIRTQATGEVARQLAVLLFFEGLTLLSSSYLELFFTPETLEQAWMPAWTRTTFIIHTFGDCAMFALYPPFLAAALKTRLTRPVAARRFRIGLAVVASVLFFAVIFSPLEIGAALLYLMLSSLFWFALVASINAWLLAPPGIAKTRAGIFTLAFGVRDVCWGFIYAFGIWQIFQGTYMTVEPPINFYAVYAFGSFAAVPLVAWGILRSRLFDIDLKVRWTIKQSTFAGLIVAILFVVSEGADRLLSSELGDFGGLMAAAVVVFLLAPLQRFAERIASVTMPNTQNTPEYAAFRKMQVYEEAVAEAQYEGGISQKERALLVRLRDSLGISASDAETIERELQARLSGSYS
ncbi:MAG: hypothetical protein WBM45_07890 [Woeseiaceae bacterium]